MANKEIVALDDFEHVRIRPEMYTGSVQATEEKVFISKNDKLISETKDISIGFYKLMDEILSNAFDEAKRMGGKMKRIAIKFDTTENSVTVVDTGGGFLNASKKNPKTNISNVASAMSSLRAGSNFKNTDTQENLIGTNGVGASVVNMLSSYFYVLTVNEQELYSQTWKDFVTDEPIIKARTTEPTGTIVKFIPSKEIFNKCKWDKNYIHTQMVFREYLKRLDPIIHNLDFICIFDNVQLDLSPSFLPAEVFKVETKIGTICVWESYPQSTSISFVNGAVCTGIHQRIFREYLNSAFESQNADKFYETFIVLNLPAKYVRFQDQNKTRYGMTRAEITPVLTKFFENHIKKAIKEHPIYENISKKIEESEREGEVKNLRSKKKAAKHKISDKYFPASDKPVNLFIVEGGCIDENEYIDVFRNYEMIRTHMKGLEIDDEVLTHNNRYRKITNFQRKLKEVITIHTSTGYIKVSCLHPLYVFDIKNSIFKFVKAIELNPTEHKLVKNNLSKFIGNAEIVSINITEDLKYSIEIILDNNIILKNSETHKYCIYDINSEQFYMKMSKELRVGDLIAMFDK